jgi:hypothetical protein
MTLTLDDFNALDEQGKGEAVFSAGTFIDDREQGELKVQLYRLGNFYVELYYDPEANAIIKYRSFKSASLLAPYLK